MQINEEIYMKRRTVGATREKIVSSKKVCVAHIKIFECLIDNIFVMLDERVFQ
jgi:hypothetical protein